MKKSLLLAVVLSCACNDPFLLASGGKLDGPVKPAPASFASVPQSETIQIETNPAEPYSVNVTAAIVGDGLYVNAGNSRSRWAENIEANPLVRARVLGDVYELKARRVTDKAEFDGVADVWVSRNAWARDPRKLEGEVYVYRLEAR